MEVKEEWIEGMVDEEGVRTPRSFGAFPPLLCSGQALLKGGNVGFYLFVCGSDDGGVG